MVQADERMRAQAGGVGGGNGHEGAEIAEQLSLGQQLYYKMLLTFLQAEERRLQTTSFCRTGRWSSSA